jgi:hypothetical protein
MASDGKGRHPIMPTQRTRAKEAAAIRRIRSEGSGSDTAVMIDARRKSEYGMECSN